MFGRISDWFDEMNLDVKLMTLRTDAFVASEEAANNIRSNEYKIANNKKKENDVESVLREKIHSAKTPDEIANAFSSAMIDALMGELPKEYRSEVEEAINKLPDKTSIFGITNCIAEIAAKHSTPITVEKTEKSKEDENEKPINGMDFSSLIKSESSDEQVHPVTQESLDKALSNAEVAK